VHNAACTTHFRRSVITPVDSGHNAPAALLLWDVRCDRDDETRQSVRTSGSGGVGSRANQVEARSAAKLAAEIAEVTDESSVAILSWYNNQVALIKELLADAGHRKIHVGTISTAQGSEWDYVILSAVRTRSSGKSLGILSDAHVLNVALTRAILGLVIMCDRDALERSEHWKALAKDCERRNLIIDESPHIARPTKADLLAARGHAREKKVILTCRKKAEEDFGEDAPMANSMKLSDADFKRQLQHTDKLASYGKASHGGARVAQPAVRKQNITVVARKGVLFGAAKKEKSWRSQISQQSPRSNSASPSRMSCTSRSRSPRRSSPSIDQT